MVDSGFDTVVVDVGVNVGEVVDVVGVGVVVDLAIVADVTRKKLITIFSLSESVKFVLVGAATKDRTKNVDFLIYSLVALN